MRATIDQGGRKRKEMKEKGNGRENRVQGEV